MRFCSSHTTLLLPLLCAGMLLFSANPLSFAQSLRQHPDSVGRPPSAVHFLPRQDSAYYRALQLKLPPDLRFQLDLFALRTYWLQHLETQQQSVEARIRANLQLPDTTWLPTAAETAQYAYHLAQAQNIPTVTMRQIPGLVGLSIPLQTIAHFLGIGADTEPEISFRLRDYAKVEIAVYSPQAKKIATIFQGTKAPGKYTVRWNGTTDNGFPVSPGEYILEVRVRGSRDRFIRRKLIEWKSQRK